MSHESNEYAVCRNCGTRLDGQPYHLGGEAYLSDGKLARKNWYGGYVCSKTCDIAATLEMKSSFPGAGQARKLDSQEYHRIEKAWDE